MPEDVPKKNKRSKKPNFNTQLDISVLEKTPPHDIDAERAVIGAILIQPELCDEVLLVITTPDDFYFDAHRRIFSHIMKMKSDSSNIDLILLSHNLKLSNELELVGEQHYIGELMSSVPTSVHALHYAKIVKDKATLRKLIHVGSEAIREAYAPQAQARDLLNKAALDMTLLCENQTINQVTDMARLMLEVSDHMERKATGGVDGVRTGFGDLDNLIEGFHPNELIILAARPGMGKTALALNIVENIAVNDKNTVLFVSLEMSRIELAMRLICSRGQLDSGLVRKNFLRKEERERLFDIISELEKAPLFIDDTPGRSISEIAAVARRLQRQHDLKLLVIDYISLITPDSPEDPRQEQVAKIARRLKGLARELSIPVLCLAQVNRQGDTTGRKDERPRLSHLRESGAIEQDADVVMFIHRKETTMSEEDASAGDHVDKAELLIAKQRNGATGDIPLHWKGEYTRFYSPATYQQMATVEDFASYRETAGIDDVPAL